MKIPGNRRVTLLVCGRYLVTQDQERTIVDHGGVAMAGDTIVEVGPGRELLARYPGVEVIDEPHGLIMPGLVNTHTHAAMACFRGLADDLPLMQWLQEYIFPVEAELTGEMVFHSTRLSIAEMIRSGTTSFCDMYLFAKEVARAAAAAGMRGWIGEVLYDFPSPNYGPLDQGVRYTEELIGMCKQEPLITATVDPHAVYTCAPELLTRLKKLADKHDALYVIHLSENKEEVRGAKERFGCSPVLHLERLGILDERVLADHCVELTGEEIELLAARGVKVAHCPESNMKLAAGVAPVPGLLAAGVSVGLGTDGSASNNNVDMFGEMNTAALLHKVFARDPTVLDARTSLDLATVGGAAALSANEMIGSLEPGKKADIIVLDLNQPHLTPVYNLPSHLVYAARGGDVVHSVINGRQVMRNRHLLTLNEAAVLENMNELSRKISAIRG